MNGRGFITMLGGTAVWRLATAVLLSSLLTWKAEARTWICWWDYPGPICTIVKPAKSTMRVEWAGISHRKLPRLPARLLGRLWRMPVLGVAFKKSTHNAAFQSFILHHVQERRRNG